MRESGAAVGYDSWCDACNENAFRAFEWMQEHWNGRKERKRKRGRERERERQNERERAGGKIEVEDTKSEEQSERNGERKGSGTFRG